MPRYKPHLHGLLPVLLLAVLGGSVVIVGWPGSAKSVKITGSSGHTANVSAVCTASNMQREWLFYVALVSHLINTDKEVASSDFAVALSRWQRSVGLAPSGSLDSATWSQMVKTWQSRRITDRTSPSAEQLLTAPAADFYDSSRVAELRKVEHQTYRAYKQMVAAARADASLKLAVTKNGELALAEKRLKIISAFRSQEYQAQLRRQLPSSGRAVLALNSTHFTGRALDLYVGGEPVIAKDANRALQMQTPVYRWLVKNAEKFGFYPYYYEPWHWEYAPR